MKEDPIVQEVRAIRQKHAEKFGFDLQAIVEDIQRQEKNSPIQFVTRPPRKAVIWQSRKTHH